MIPVISVVMPLHNKLRYVGAAIRSVLEQTFEDLELIVVDDGSTDGSDILVREFRDPRIMLFYQANAGAAAARNTGITVARGRWIAFLDADDRWVPDKLARQMELLEREPELVWAAGTYLRAGPGLADVAHKRCGSELLLRFGVLGESLLALAAGCLWTGAIIVRRDVLIEIGGFDSSLTTGEDVFLWAQIAARHPRLAYIDDAIAYYRYLGAGSLTERQDTDDSIHRLARRILELADTLPGERSAALWRIAEGQLVQQAKRQILAGQWKAALATLVETERLTESPRARWLRALTCWPARAFMPAWRWVWQMQRRTRREAAQ